MNDSTAIDLAVFGELQANTGADFVAELVDTFLDEAPQLLKQLHQARSAGDADSFRRTSHSLKSNGNTFGAMAFAAQARSLELGGLAEADDALLSRLELLFQQAAGRLRELCHG
ncbi:Hpt domain-containing protein [Pelomonas sp. SE-A7]|uniref:Hpt domain-containing protein n=1 Tax=Pelomonas sp. SE-A7 TaxID=3054953 RepID=UPI00259C89D4|nr:Hpt domain-containing protein [Pelomonas sp. SE-A7]MDM4767754.1 Hpt domain-containing protein [Pelomonas sp. SE-A7]